MGDDHMEKQSENLDDGNNNANGVSTCEICIEPLVYSTIFNDENQSCKHLFCDDCMAKYITVQVEQFGSNRIKCPGLDCPNILDPLSCRSLIAPAIFSRWCELLCKSAVLGLEKTSYCPNVNCSELVVDECGETEKKTTCPNCKLLFCFSCKSEWHPQFRCNERKDANDVLLDKLMLKNRWKRCPNCHRVVERVLGCSTIICRCNTLFCYLCGKKATSSRSRCACELADRPMTLGDHCAVWLFISILLLWCTFLVYSYFKYN